MVLALDIKDGCGLSNINMACCEHIPKDTKCAVLAIQWHSVYKRYRLKMSSKAENYIYKCRHIGNYVAIASYIKNLKES